MPHRPLPPPAQRDWAYFLDFDGTLLDLAVTPDAIEVDAALADLVAALHRNCGGALALISGRALADLETRLTLPAVPKAGQHGLERRDAAGRLWLHAAPPRAKQTMRTALEPFLARRAGLILEDKGLTLALHYRQAPALEDEVRQLMRRLVVESGENLVVQDGKCVVEVKPAGIDKGTAVAEYLAEPPFVGRRPVFVGDDRNDEHAFALVNARGGVSVGVGAIWEHGSCAHYRVADVAGARAWLAGLLEEPA